MRIVERTVVKDVATAPAVAEWNFWDFEHGPFVHKGHVNHSVLFEDETTAVVMSVTRAPIFSFLKYSSLHVMVRVSPSLSRAWNRGLFGIVGAVDYHFEQSSPDHTRITMNYRFYLSGWQIVLGPLLYRLIAAWSEQIWIEDLGLKLRRQKVLRLGFKDFIGLPVKIADRRNDGELNIKLPLPKLKDSPVLRLPD